MKPKALFLSLVVLLFIGIEISRADENRFERRTPKVIKNEDEIENSDKAGFSNPKPNPQNPNKPGQRPNRNIVTNQGRVPVTRNPNQNPNQRPNPNAQAPKAPQRPPIRQPQQQQIPEPPKQPVIEEPSNPQETLGNIPEFDSQPNNVPPEQDNNNVQETHHIDEPQADQQNFHPEEIPQQQDIHTPEPEINNYHAGDDHHHQDPNNFHEPVHTEPQHHIPPEHNPHMHIDNPHIHVDPHIQEQMNNIHNQNPHHHPNPEIHHPHHQPEHHIPSPPEHINHHIPQEHIHQPEVHVPPPVHEVPVHHQHQEIHHDPNIHHQDIPHEVPHHQDHHIHDQQPPHDQDNVQNEPVNEEPVPEDQQQPEEHLNIDGNDEYYEEDAWADQPIEEDQDDGQEYQDDGQNQGEIYPDEEYPADDQNVDQEYYDETAQGDEVQQQGEPVAEPVQHPEVPQEHREPAGYYQEKPPQPRNLHQPSHEPQHHAPEPVHHDNHQQQQHHQAHEPVQPQVHHEEPKQPVHQNQNQQHHQPEPTPQQQHQQQQQQQQQAHQHHQQQQAQQQQHAQQQQREQPKEEPKLKFDDAAYSEEYKGVPKKSALDTVESYADSAIILLEETVVPLYRLIRANKYLNFIFTISLIFGIIKRILRLFGLGKKETKVNSKLVARRNFTQEEKSEINENFRKFADEIYQLRDRLDKFSNGGVSSAAVQGAQASGASTEVLSGLYKDLENLASNLSESHKMINLAVEEQTELRDFSVIRKEVADSHKTIHTKLIELQGALVQLKNSASQSKTPKMVKSPINLVDERSNSQRSSLSSHRSIDGKDKFFEAIKETKEREENKERNPEFTDSKSIYSNGAHSGMNSQRHKKSESEAIQPASARGILSTSDKKHLVKKSVEIPPLQHNLHPQQNYQQQQSQQQAPVIQQILSEKDPEDAPKETPKEENHEPVETKAPQVDPTPIQESSYKKNLRLEVEQEEFKVDEKPPLQLDAQKDPELTSTTPESSEAIIPKANPFNPGVRTIPKAIPGKIPVKKPIPGAGGPFNKPNFPKAQINSFVSGDGTTGGSSGV